MSSRSDWPRCGCGALSVVIGYVSATGYPVSLTRRSDRTVYATITAMDAFGHASAITEANGVSLTRGLKWTPKIGQSFKVEFI